MEVFNRNLNAPYRMVSMVNLSYHIYPKRPTFHILYRLPYLCWGRDKHWKYF